MKSTRIIFPYLLVVVAAIFAIPSFVLANDFRMETEVFIEGGSRPATKSLTLFNGNTVYDFLSGEQVQGEITVFDVSRGRFVLIDTDRKLKTTLTKDYLIKFLEQVKSQASEDVVSRFVSPKLAQKFNPSTKTVTVSSDHLTYQATGIPARWDPAIQKYRHFADWIARLNSTRIGNLPPYSRFELNRVMAEQKLMPKTIQRTVMLDRVGLRKQVVRSEHNIHWQLTNSDRKRISSTGNLMAACKEVSVNEFWQTQSQVSK
ncbi:MAG: hypothetical protein CMJ76_09505 [Planctomycetaceae bacterium]|nr:hypothetical protein [Planctomycetaceae bacterium]